MELLSSNNRLSQSRNVNTSRAAELAEQHEIDLKKGLAKAPDLTASSMSQALFLNAKVRQLNEDLGSIHGAISNYRHFFEEGYEGLIEDALTEVAEKLYQAYQGLTSEEDLNSSDLSKMLFETAKLYWEQDYKCDLANGVKNFRAYSEVMTCVYGAARDMLLKAIKAADLSFLKEDTALSNEFFGNVVKIFDYKGIEVSLKKGSDHHFPLYHRNDYRRLFELACSYEVYEIIDAMVDSDNEYRDEILMNGVNSLEKVKDTLITKRKEQVEKCVNDFARDQKEKPDLEQLTKFAYFTMKHDPLSQRIDRYTEVITSLQS